MTDSIHTTELASDADIAEIRALAGSRSVMHWPGILRVINRLEAAERERDEARAALRWFLAEPRSRSGLVYSPPDRVAMREWVQARPSCYGEAVASALENGTSS